MNSRIPLAVLGVLALSACTTSPQSLVLVHTNAERGVQSASGSYVVRVEGRALGGTFIEEHRETYQAWGRDFTLGPREHDASRSYRVTLIAFQGRNGDGAQIARNVLISGYVQSQTRQYDLILYDACQGVECGENELCDIAGNCMPAEIPPTNLPLFDGGTDEDGGAVPDTPSTDAGRIDVPLSDTSGFPDITVFPDGTPGVDGGPRVEAGPEFDAGPGSDAGPSDASFDTMRLSDGGPMDAATDGMAMVDGGFDGGGLEDAAVPMDAPDPIDAFSDAMPGCPDEGAPCVGPGFDCIASGVVVCDGSRARCEARTVEDAGTPCGFVMPDSCPSTCDGLSPTCPTPLSCDVGEVCCMDGASCGASGC